MKCQICEARKKAEWIHGVAGPCWQCRERRREIVRLVSLAAVVSVLSAILFIALAYAAR